MEQFKCPMCNGLQETLEINMEVVASESIMMVNETSDDLIEAATIGIEASCSFCTHSGDPDEFIVVDELTEEEQNELDSRPVEGQIVLKFPSDFE